jgi:hypothetical protein
LFWSQTGESQVFGPEVLKDAEKQVQMVHESLKVAQTQQKSSPMRGTRRFKVKEKLAPRYVGPFKIVDRRGEVAYQLELPPQLSDVHDVFLISQLKKCLRVLEEQLPMEELDLGGDLTYSERPVKILEIAERVTRCKVIKMCKVQWITTPRMKLPGNMKKSSEQITPNYSQALPKSRGRDSFKGGRFVTPTFCK